MLDQAIGMIRSCAEPLAIYLFSADKEDRRKVMDRTKSGGLCINDLLFHASVSGLPFGGTGRSGMGSYHGRAGFETFTVRKSVMLRSRFPDFDLRYPPYGKWKFGFLKRLLTWLS
jgi:aldehyde dehydrogenase (NAD+)/aldehyde dehydrogenase (NAD(P)+)